VCVPVCVSHNICVFRGELELTEERSQELISISTEQGFPQWSAWGKIMLGWALAEQGRGDEGIVEVCQGLASRRAEGSEVARPYFLSLLAEAYGKVDQAEEGLKVVAEALGAVDKGGERSFESELNRLKGELLLALCEENQAEAETCFRRAIDIASQQSAKSLELRASMSLSRLLQRKGKSEEARLMLSEIYGMFKEGFDTADLIEARELLGGLS